MKRSGAALIMNPKVWEASGHIATFNDPMVECKNAMRGIGRIKILRNVKC